MTASESVSDVCTTLDRKLSHVLEARMRIALVREQILTAPAEESAAWLVAVLDRSPALGAVDPLRDAVVEVLGPADEESATDAVAAPIPYAYRCDLYAAAVAMDGARLIDLLRSQRLDGDGDGAARRLPPEIAEIPLGRRRALAKGDDPYLLEKLALDPDARVIANLLGNPRLCERDVVRIAALRPVPASTLEEVARSRRWSTRPRVRVALARNPHCPVTLTMKLLGRLPLPDLRAMRHDPDLPAATRERVETEIARRG